MMSRCEIEILLWGIFVFLIVICIGKVGVLTEGFVENFGSTCVDFIPFESYKKFPKKPDTIFVSVASYRDAECSRTLETIFGKADHPDRIFVGICEQNKNGELGELCIGPNIQKYSDQIRILKMDHKEAKGPTLARYYCADLWKGEEFFLQIDSHTTFVDHWDSDLIEMIRQIQEDPKESNKPVLSSYPPTKEQMKISGFPEMDNGYLGNNKLPIFLSGWSNTSSKPRRSNKPWAGAGFMFLDSTFLYTVPFDPNLSHLFQGEEVLFSARLFTNGYDFYTPNKKVAFHHYSRPGPMYHTDIPESTGCRGKAEKRVLFLLGLGKENTVAEEFLKQIHYYGLGKKRSMDDFWKASGIDLTKIGQDGIEKWNDRHKPSSKYSGWWFRGDGYKNIKKIY
jgi:hypothetical protein